jgi:hypothetical protein
MKIKASRGKGNGGHIRDDKNWNKSKLDLPFLFFFYLPESQTLIDASESWKSIEKQRRLQTDIQHTSLGISKKEQAK